MLPLVKSLSSTIMGNWNHRQSGNPTRCLDLGGPTSMSCWGFLSVAGVWQVTCGRRRQPAVFGAVFASPRRKSHSDSTAWTHFSLQAAVVKTGNYNAWVSGKLLAPLWNWDVALHNINALFGLVEKIKMMIALPFNIKRPPAERDSDGARWKGWRESWAKARLRWVCVSLRPAAIFTLHSFCSLITHSSHRYFSEPVITLSNVCQEADSVITTSHIKTKALRHRCHVAVKLAAY